jgi:hypothetical protein
MFQPISFNVIRQALEWHGFPVPKLRQLSLDDHDPDFVTAEYVATWTPEQANAIPCSEPDFPIGPTLTLFIDKLQACFCHDVQVHSVERSEPGDNIVAFIYVKVDRGLLYWAQLLEVIWD